ncbi:unnamed protein product [Sphagnum balticum]
MLIYQDYMVLSMLDNYLKVYRITRDRKADSGGAHEGRSSSPNHRPKLGLQAFRNLQALGPSLRRLRRQRCAAPLSPTVLLHKDGAEGQDMPPRLQQINEALGRGAALLAGGKNLVGPAHKPLVAHRYAALSGRQTPLPPWLFLREAIEQPGVARREV